MTKTILVTAATGKQGRATVDALVASNEDFEILALTRNIESAGAQKLAAKSPKVKLVSGNLDQPEAVFEAAEKAASGPIWGLFSVQALAKNSDDEETQGKNLHTAALAHNIKYIVYSSVDRHGTQPTPVPHFRSKHNIEQHLFSSTANTETKWCVLRPVAFMDNTTELGQAFATCWKVTLGTDVPLQLIACSDIGYFAAQAFLRPDEHAGQCISLAGDKVNFVQADQGHREVTGQPWGTFFGFIAKGFLMFNSEMRIMFEWFKEVGYDADVEALRKVHPGLKTWKMFLEQDMKLGKK